MGAIEKMGMRTGSFPRQPEHASVEIPVLMCVVARQISSCHVERLSPYHGIRCDEVSPHEHVLVVFWYCHEVVAVPEPQGVSVRNGNGGILHLHQAPLNVVC